MQGLSHLYALSYARLWVETRQAGAVWRGERQLRHEQGSVRRTTTADHRPDAEVMIGAQRVAIEVELSDKVSGRLAAILYELARTYAGIWYFCPPKTEGELRRAIGELNPRRSVRSSPSSGCGWRGTVPQPAVSPAPPAPGPGGA